MYGGGDIGLMGTVARAVHAHKGVVRGIMPKVRYSASQQPLDALIPASLCRCPSPRCTVAYLRFIKLNLGSLGVVTGRSTHRFRCIQCAKRIAIHCPSNNPHMPP